MFYGQFFTALCGFGQLTCAWITRHSSGTQAEVRRRLGSSAALPSEGSLQLRAPLDSNSSASLWLSADTSSPGGMAPGPLSWRLGDVLGWQSGRHADLTVWLVVKKPPVCRLGHVVYPPRLLRGAHLNVACCQRWSGRFYIYFFYLTLTGRVSPDVSSFFPSPDFHLLRPMVMLPVSAAATVPGIGELPGARSAAGSRFLLLSAVSTGFNSMNACSGFCPLLSAF